MAKNKARVRPAQEPSLDDPPLDLIAKMSADAGRGVSMNPEDSIWLGENGELDTSAALSAILMRKSLEEILLAIIDSFPGALTGDAGGAYKRRYRLRQAMRLLVGEKPAVGGPTKVGEDTLRAMATDFWVSFASGSSRTLWDIAAEFAAPDWRRRGLTYDDVNPLTKPYLRAFNRNSDALLVEMSAKGLPELDMQVARVGLALKVLRELEIVK